MATTELRWQRGALWLAGVATCASALWPFTASWAAGALTEPPWAVMVLMPLVAFVAAALVFNPLAEPRTIAHVAVLAIGVSMARLLSAGTYGMEIAFFVLIVSGYAAGAHLGFVLGVLSIAVSALVTGGVGPWLAFQMLGCGWVACGAGALGDRARRHAALAREPHHVMRQSTRWVLTGYTVVACYAFGAAMNLWFWPFVVDTTSAVAYNPEHSVRERISSYVTYTLVTSTATWDSVRAVTNSVLVAVVGPAVTGMLGHRLTRRSTSLVGGGTQTHPLTVPGPTVTPH